MALLPGQTTLATIRTTAQQRADMVNSNFVGTTEWNSYINSSAQELYDILIQEYSDDYYVATPYSFQTDGLSDQFALPDGSGIAPAFYKLLGVDLQLTTSPDAYVTLSRFNRRERNRNRIPNIQTAYGYTNLRYRLNGSNLWFTPRPSANLTIRIWYAPRFVPLVNDADVLDGVSGWEEYVVVDAVIKAKVKEEDDVSVEMALKEALLKRITEAATNRDAGSPATTVDVYSNTGWPGSDPHGGGGYY